VKKKRPFKPIEYCPECGEYLENCECEKDD